MAIDVMQDIMVQALARDQTRMASLQFSRGFSNVVHRWIGMNTAHHTMSHDESRDRRPEIVKIDNWYAGKVARLLSKLDAIPEGNGTLLDNTIVVWGREMATCRHSFASVPFVLAGGKNLGLRTGRWKHWAAKHSALLVSLCQILGLADVNTFGNNAPDTGPLADLT